MDIYVYVCMNIWYGQDAASVFCRRGVYTYKYLSVYGCMCTCMYVYTVLPGYSFCVTHIQLLCLAMEDADMYVCIYVYTCITCIYMCVYTYVYIYTYI